MFHRLQSSLGVGLSLVLFAIENIFVKDAAACSDGSPIVKVVTTLLFVEYPLYISTDIMYNTSFAVNDDVMITVDNAPTSFVLSTIGTAKQTVTRTVSE